MREVDDRLLGQDLARSAEQEMAVRELVTDCTEEGAIVRLPVKKTVPVFSFLTGTLRGLARARERPQVKYEHQGVASQPQLKKSMPEDHETRFPRILMLPLKTSGSPSSGEILPTLGP